jgi:hypothetical protein
VAEQSSSHSDRLEYLRARRESQTRVRGGGRGDRRGGGKRWAREARESEGVCWRASERRERKIRRLLARKRAVQAQEKGAVVGARRRLLARPPSPPARSSRPLRSRHKRKKRRLLSAREGGCWRARPLLPPAPLAAQAQENEAVVGARRRLLACPPAPLAQEDILPARPGRSVSFPPPRSRRWRTYSPE